MTLVSLQSLSLPGRAGQPNEDAFGHAPHAALVMDGATGLGDPLMPGPSDAAWISQFGVRRVLAHLGQGVGARKALRDALGDTRKSFEALRRHPPQHLWQTPCASMMLAVVHSSRLDTDSVPDADSVDIEFLWFGDCAALLVREGRPVLLVGTALEKRTAEAAAARKLAQEKNLAPAGEKVRDQLLPALRARRVHMNTDNNWLFSPDPNAAAHAGRKVVAVPRGSHLLLATDGFLALVSDYGAYDLDGLARAVWDKGLAALGAQLRTIEAGDEDGVRFPRFKTSDDATALWLRLD